MHGRIPHSFFQNFIGVIPRELGDCTNLVNLYLHDNGFTGTVPSSLGNLERLGSLRVYHNELTGEIPTGVCHLKENETLTYVAADCESAVLNCECCDKCY
jgi:hypothetical protein